GAAGPGRADAAHDVLRRRGARLRRDREGQVGEAPRRRARAGRAADRGALARRVQARAVPGRVPQPGARGRELQGGRQGDHRRRAGGPARAGDRPDGRPQAEPRQARGRRGPARRGRGGRRQEAARQGAPARRRVRQGQEGASRAEMTDFSTHEVAKILGLPDSKMRSCARAALLAPVRGPGGRLRWSFQDLLLLKTTRGLLEARVPPRRIRRMLASLRRQLPADQALWSASTYADGRRAIAWDGTARWQPDSGQFLFSFDARAVAIPDAPSATRPAAATPSPPPARSAEEWFDLAGELDPASPDEARHAYEQALALDPGLTD